eukprot:PhM_4_TR2925/c0_g1_i1/m.51151
MSVRSTLLLIIFYTLSVSAATTNNKNNNKDPLAALAENEDFQNENALCNVCEMIATDLYDRMQTAPLGETFKGGRIIDNDNKKKKKQTDDLKKRTHIIRAHELVDETCTMENAKNRVKNKNKYPHDLTYFTPEAFQSGIIGMCQKVVEEIEEDLVAFVLSGGGGSEDVNKTICSPLPSGQNSNKDNKKKNKKGSSHRRRDFCSFRTNLQSQMNKITEDMKKEVMTKKKSKASGSLLSWSDFWEEFKEVFYENAYWVVFGGIGGGVVIALLQIIFCGHTNHRHHGGGRQVGSSSVVKTKQA